MTANEEDQDRTANAEKHNVTNIENQGDNGKRRKPQRQ